VYVVTFTGGGQTTLTAGPGPIQIISQVGPQGAASTVPGPTGPTGYTGDRGQLLIVTMTGTTPVSWSINNGGVNIIAQTGPTGQRGDPGPASVGAQGPTGATGTFQTNYTGEVKAGKFTATSTVSAPTHTGNVGYFNDFYFGGVSVWSGMQQIALANGVNAAYPGNSLSGNITYQRIGKFTAVPGGAVIKINYVHCIRFNVNDAITQNGITQPKGPQIIDLCIYFYTSNNGDYVQMPDGTKVQGYGWCTSTHVTNAPAAVYVKSAYTGTAASTDPRDFDFYVETGPYVGNPIITAATSAFWTPNYLDGGGTARPTNALRLPMASVMHSSNANYLSVNAAIV